MVVGVVTGAWGVRGAVKVDPLTYTDRRFEPGSVVYLAGAPTRVLDSRRSKRTIILALDGVVDRNVAESLRGTELTIAPDQLEALPEGSYYHFDIVGMDVYTEEGERLGAVKEIIVTGGNDVYVVGGAPRDILIPALRDVVLDIAKERNRMTVRLPEGLR